METVELDFPTWCKDNGISRKTESSLRKEECHTLESITLLTERDLREMGLAIGQRNMLLKVIRGLTKAPLKQQVQPEVVAESEAAEAAVGEDTGDGTNINDMYT